MIMITYDWVVGLKQLDGLLIVYLCNYIVCNYYWDFAALPPDLYQP